MKTENLTKFEILVLEASRKTDFGDCLEYGQWSFAVCNKSGLDEKIYRGVVSSLVKKGLISIWDEGGKGRFKDQVFEFTDKGRELFIKEIGK
jgi:hypothetical protein